MAAPALTTLMGPLTSFPVNPEEKADDKAPQVTLVSFTVCSSPIRAASMGLVARVITTSFTRALIPIPMVAFAPGPVLEVVLRGMDDVDNGKVG